MRTLSTLRFRRRLTTVLALASVMATVGCHSWRPVPGEMPAPLTAADGSMRLIRTDGTEMRFWSPVVQGDSVRLLQHRDWVDGQQVFDTVTVALADIESVERKEFNAGKTVLTVVGIPFAALGAMIALLMIMCVDGCSIGS